MLARCFCLFCLSSLSAFGTTSVLGKVVGVGETENYLEVSIVRTEGNVIPPGQVVKFQVSKEDHEIGYLDRGIRANGVQISDDWQLGQVFPASGPNISAMRDTNRNFREFAEQSPKGSYLKEGDMVPNFAMFDQNGDVLPIHSLKGHPFVLNFIFTRCGMPEMCPASTKRMKAMQEQARMKGIDELRFVTISFDPAFDSPGVLKAYAEGYGIELDNFHFLTASQELVDDLLRVFGILTRDEYGTINHTMATLLIDAEARIATRQEGPDWESALFLEVASQL